METVTKQGPRPAFRYGMRMKTLFRLDRLAVLTAGLCLIGGAQAGDLLVKTESGVLQGFSKNVIKTDRAVEVFLGVPYAAAPTGDLRWKAPQPAEKWKGVRDASVMPSACTQASGGSEDCLYLNIYRPAGVSPEERLPVAVYWHGGDHVSGKASDFDGSRFASYSKLIVVTVQYRLGVFGFLNLPSSMDGEGGAFGLQDMTAALRWVKRNIGRFGGDASSVTVMGQGSGASDTCRLLVNPDAAGLFHGVVLQSTDCRNGTVGVEQSVKRSQEFVGLTDCADDKETIACLRSLPASAIQKAGETVGDWAPAARSSAASIIARGNWNKVHVLMGSNRDEGRAEGAAFIGRNESDYKRWVTDQLGSAAAKALVRYPAYKYTSKYAIPYVAGDLISDSGMKGYGGCATLDLARTFVKAGAPAVYLYEFQDENAPMIGRTSDYETLASHGAEQAYMWPDAFAMQSRSERLTPEQWDLANVMRRYWGLFVRYKNPNTKNLPSWRSFSPSDSVMVFRPGEEGVATVSVDAIETAHKCSFWDTVRRND